MANAPFIFTFTCTLKEGKLEAFKQYLRSHAEFVEASEPRLIHFGAYFNEAGTEVTIVQVHPDPASLALHMQISREHFVEAYEFIDAIKSQEFYGTPGDAVVQQIKQVSGPGVPVMVKPQFAGFTRLPTAAAV